MHFDAFWMLLTCKKVQMAWGPKWIHPGLCPGKADQGDSGAESTKWLF